MRPSRSGLRDRVDLHQSTSSETQAPAPADMKRRGFLLGLSVGSAGAAAMAVGAIGTTGAVSAALPAASSSSESGGYQVTQHVRNYYRSTKL